MNYVRLKFAEADVDGSGRVDAAELAEVLRKAGITPITGWESNLQEVSRPLSALHVVFCARLRHHTPKMRIE